MKNKFAFWSFISALVPVAEYILFTLSLMIFGFSFGSSTFNVLSEILGISFFVFGPVSIVLGILGLTHAKEEGGRNLSIIGMIISGFLLLVIFFIMFNIFLK
jgi:hypothetical protein